MEGNSSDHDHENSYEQNCNSQRCCGSSKPLLSEERMRRKLQFFFMNPIEKWQAKKRFPYKFGVQVIKIFLLTIQLCLFAAHRYNHVNYTWDNRVSFSHLFLRDWDATREVNAYPPSIGPLAVYKVEDFYATLDYAYDAYTKLENAVGSYSYASENNVMPDMKFCLYHYKQGTIFGFNESYIFDSEIVENCVNISEAPNVSLKSEQYLSNHNIDVKFDALVRAELLFSIKTINLKAASRLSTPNCFIFNIKIIFDNEDHDGQILLSLEADSVQLKCRGDVVITDEIQSFIRSVLNFLVIIVCIISLILCVRAVWRAQQLKVITNKFFLSHFQQELNQQDKLKFLNIWYIMIIINDILIIIGSTMKELIENGQFASDHWNVCSLFLGVGNMLIWFGVLRYLGFFKTYNVVILTLQKATPQVARFLLCALLIYAGFTFSGWLILGPYHFKFRSLSTTSECLFSLINGDDMFATFSIMSDKSRILWWFSRIYLYSFISLYIYVILSLFISVIGDAYDTIKLYYKEGFPKSSLDCFIGDTCLEDVSSGIFRSSSNDSLGGLIKDLCCCRPLQKSYASMSQTSLDNSRQSIPV